VAISDSNATGLLAVFEEFGFGDIGIGKADFLEPDFVVEIGREPRKIQVPTGIDGVTFEECRKHEITETYGGMSLRFIGIEELLKNKQASARDKDLIDLQARKTCMAAINHRCRSLEAPGLPQAEGWLSLRA
jgi:hypothetical protein